MFISFCSATVCQSALPTFCKSDWFLVWSIVAEPSLHLKMLLENSDLKRDKASFVLRKLSWELILDRYCSTEIPILVTSDEIVGWQSLVNCLWMLQGQHKHKSLLPSSNFRAFQILSDTFTYSQIFSSTSAEQIKAVKCWPARVNNGNAAQPDQRSRPWNVDLWEHSTRQADSGAPNDGIFPKTSEVSKMF